MWLTVLLSVFQFPCEMKETQSQSRTGVVRETGLASQEGTGHTKMWSAVKVLEA